MTRNASKQGNSAVGGHMFVHIFALYAGVGVAKRIPRTTPSLVRQYGDSWEGTPQRVSRHFWALADVTASSCKLRQKINDNGWCSHLTSCRIIKCQRPSQPWPSNTCIFEKYKTILESPVSSYRAHRCAMGFDGPPPDGFPLWQWVRVHCSPICPPEEWPPLVCPMGHDGWPHPFVGGATHQLNPLKPHLQRISKITVCSRKPATGAVRSLFSTGGREAGGSRSKNLIEGPWKANARPGAHSEAPGWSSGGGASPAPRTGKPGQSAHDWSTQGVFPWKTAFLRNPQNPWKRRENTPKSKPILKRTKQGHQRKGSRFIMSVVLFGSSLCGTLDIACYVVVIAIRDSSR